jgi:hypothetical protein
MARNLKLVKGLPVLTSITLKLTFACMIANRFTPMIGL